MKAKLVAVLCTVLFLLTSCYSQSQIQFSQPLNQISRIVLVDNTKTRGETVPQELLVIESESDIEEFIAEFQTIRCERCWNDPCTDFGFLYVEITYKNGGKEVFGTGSIVYVQSNGVFSNSNGYLYVDLDSMLDLFDKYTGTEIFIQ